MLQLRDATLPSTIQTLEVRAARRSFFKKA